MRVLCHIQPPLRTIPLFVWGACRHFVGGRDFPSKKQHPTAQDDDDGDAEIELTKVHWFPSGASHKTLLAHSFFPLVQETFPTTTLRLPSWGNVTTTSQINEGDEVSTSNADMAVMAGGLPQGFTEADFDFKGWGAIRNFDDVLQPHSALAAMLEEQQQLHRLEGGGFPFADNIPFCPRKMLLKNELPEFSPDYHNEARDEMVPSTLRNSNVAWMGDASKREQAAGRLSSSSSSLQLCLDGVGIIGGFEPADMNRNANLSQKVLGKISSFETVQIGLGTGASIQDRDDIHSVRKRLRKYYDLEGRLGSGEWGECQMVVTLPVSDKVLDLCALELCHPSDGSNMNDTEAVSSPSGAVSLPPPDKRFNNFVFRLGFGNNHTNIGTLNLQKCESLRKGQRAALGFSLELLKERLPSPLIKATRLIHNVCRDALPRDALPPPLFWLSCVTQFTNVSLSSEEYKRIAVEESDQELICSLAKGTVKWFLEHSATTSSLSTTTTTSSSCSHKEHHIMRNIFLPGEDFAKLDTVATLVKLAASRKGSGFERKWLKLF